MTHTATWHGKVLAKSDNTLEVGGYQRPDLRSSASRATACRWSC